MAKEKACPKPVTTRYEKLFRMYMLELFFVLVVTSVLLILGIILVESAPYDMHRNVIVGGCFVLGAVILLVFICAFYLPMIIKKKLRCERIESANFYKKVSDTIFVKLPITAYGQRNRRIKKPVVISKCGFHNDDIAVSWADYTISVAAVSIFGTIIPSFLLEPKAGTSGEIIQIQISPKSFYLVKNFSGLEIENINEAEDWLKSSFKLVPREVSTCMIPVDSIRFRTFYPLVISIVFVFMISAMVPLAVLLTNQGMSIGLVSGIIGGLSVMVMLPITAIFPKGRTYVSRALVVHKDLISRSFTMDPDTMRVRVGKFRIVFSNGVSSFAIYKSKRAVMALEQLGLLENKKNKHQ